MHASNPATRHGGPERIFQGHSSRIYDHATHLLLRGVYRRIAEDIADAAPDGGTVLDTGAGSGRLLVEIARRRSDLTLVGVDLSPDMTALAQRNLRPYEARASARTGDVADLPFPEDSFGLIVSTFSLHHWADPRAAVPELARVLAPGCRLYLYDLRFAPFNDVVTAARENSLLTGRPHRRTPIRTGSPLLPWCVRHVMANPA